ncbi:MAG TPA: hypothetical protein PK668_21360 [Myxococcota bacterium]|nr:hypothetical protein [Myxococcota bacterium]HRY96024.1 hypothetical protein [Myxococcota bacterium]HSA21888.1 hypothetical protein [Myxococcota bacterium]
MRPSLAAALACLAGLLLPAAAPAADLQTALARVERGAIGLVGAEVRSGVLQVTLDEAALGLRGRDQEREDLVLRLLWAARVERPGLEGIQVWVRLPDGKRLSLSEATRDPAEAALSARLAALPARPRPVPELPPDSLPYGGSLVGRTIALSPGHGWLWYDNLGAWSTQRGLINLPDCSTCLGIVEDFSNNQITTRYLIPHLLRAGGRVWSARERDLSTVEVVLDDGGAGVLEQGAWAAGVSAGGWEGDYRVLLAGGGGRVDYPLEVPREGEYWLTAWWVAGANRVRDALVRVHHLGGVSELHLDQTQDGQRWVPLGRYRLAPGAGRLELSPGPAAAPEAYLIADAVRLGGGVDGSQVQGVPADQPRWQMGARYFLPFAGLPAALDTGSDVTIRPAWAEWQGADAYLSLHSNASGSAVNNASGTSTYRYSCGAYPDHSAAPDPALCDDPPGSDRLQRAVQAAVLEFLRARWDADWRDRGALVADFGEVRVLDDTPGALVESAFHDGTVAAAGARMPDNQALQDPRFRAWLGYALYAGLARFFDSDASLLPPEPPRGVHLVHAPAGGLVCGWEPLPEALGYRVRWSVDGLELGDGLHTEATSALLADVQPGQLVSARVSGLNAGGEGPPSEWLSARYRGPGAFAELLLVPAFDRQDAYLGDGHNRNDQALAHGQAIAGVLARDTAFDCASDEAVSSGAVPLGAYRAAIWILGEESTADETFDAVSQALVGDFLASGGALMASGAEIGWDLVEQGEPADQAFFSAAFQAQYLSDDAESAEVQGVGEFASVGALAFDDGAAGIYPVEWPDVFEPLAGRGAEVVLVYGSGAGAGVASAAGPGRSLLLGFPFETVTTEATRVALMEACLRFLLPEDVVEDGGAVDGDGWDGDQVDEVDEVDEVDGVEEQADEDGGPQAEHPEGSCGCAGGTAGPAWLLGLLLVLAALRPRRNR